MWRRRRLRRVVMRRDGHGDDRCAGAALAGALLGVSLEDVHGLWWFAKNLGQWWQKLPNQLLEM